MYATLAPVYGIDQFVVFAISRNLQVDVFVAKVRSHIRPPSLLPISCAIAMHVIFILSQMLPKAMRFRSVITATPFQRLWLQLNARTLLNVQDMCEFVHGVFKCVSQWLAQRVISGIGGVHVTLAIRLLSAANMVNIAELVSSWSQKLVDVRFWRRKQRRIFASSPFQWR